MTNALDRRDFMKLSAVAGAGALLSRCSLPTKSAVRLVAPGAKLRVAVIGVGGRGMALVDHMAGEQLAAFCDVDDRTAKEAYDKFPAVPRFRDYRVLLDQLAGELDAVVVETPDHMHAPIALAAMNRGLHCYCEKPLTWSIGEARLMAETARATGAVTQMGNQGTGADGFRRGVELLRGGALGAVRRITVWTNRPVWPQAMERFATSAAVPPELDWNLWLGGAAERPFHPDYQPFNWRGWYDFGTGALGDMGCHTVNLAYRGLELPAPEWVVADSSPLFAETYPAGTRVTYRFPASGKHGPITMNWYDGTMRPDPRIFPESFVPHLKESGLLIEGEKGSMLSVDDYGTEQIWNPAELGQIDVPQSLPRAKSHYDEFIQACKGGPKTQSAFEVAGPFTELILLGNLALRTGKPILWRARSMTAVGVPEAGELIHRRYRPGFSV